MESPSSSYPESFITGGFRTETDGSRFYAVTRTLASMLSAFTFIGVSTVMVCRSVFQPVVCVPSLSTGFLIIAEGQYEFSGNKDVEYLLTLCEKLNLFVLAAPGASLSDLFVKCAEASLIVMPL
jgi:hypothetical protein